MKNQSSPQTKFKSKESNDKQNPRSGKIQPKDSTIQHLPKINEFKEAILNNNKNITNYNFGIDAWKELCSEEIKSDLLIL